MTSLLWAMASSAADRPAVDTPDGPMLEFRLDNGRAETFLAVAALLEEQFRRTPGLWRWRR